ncbi:hypothetical protein CXB51_025298 [Gossypium anomalum]|uniref:Reverse transcriptase zinc-binding domain-containing protein n=1 Tax=Gossypium anomalum TaxID=47600 RepID=A0A8J5YGS6_9ROSI|nr:hypothetical protein CXB51_025298 [Gossypium anomalum]
MELGLQAVRLWNSWSDTYANEENCLWKKIIVAIYENRESNLLPHNLSHYNKSWVWRSIVHPLTMNDSISKSFGITLKYWPSFALAVKKVGILLISVFGLMRSGFDMWSLGDPSLLREESVEKADMLIWTKVKDRLYTPKALCSLVKWGGEPMVKLWKLVWVKLAPREWNSSFGYLCRRGILSFNSNICTLCYKYEETVDKMARNMFHLDIQMVETPKIFFLS